jgi:hypothetical protein
VHFKGWASRYDETLPSFSARIRQNTVRGPGTLAQKRSRQRQRSQTGSDDLEDLNTENANFHRESPYITQKSVTRTNFLIKT